MLRLIQGIQGLRDYAGMVADRETKEMVDANRKLKSKLTPEERQQVEIVCPYIAYKSHNIRRHYVENIGL